MGWLQLNLIRPNRWNANFLRPGEREKLRAEMAESGPERTPPIIVRQVRGGYEIIDGEQRWRIARELGWEKIKAEILEVDENEAMKLCLDYNMLRGRVDWFKLSDVMRESLEKGKNIYSIYGESLTEEEIDGILSLGEVVPEARKIAEKALRERDDVALQHLILLARFHPRYQKTTAVLLAEGTSIPELEDNLNFTWTAIRRKEERKKREEKKRQERKERVSEKAEAEKSKAEVSKSKSSKSEREEREKPETEEAELREAGRVEGEKSEEAEAEIEEAEEEKAERRIYDAKRARSFIEHGGEILIIDWEKREVRLRKVVDHQVLEEFIPDRAYTLHFKCPIRACSYMHRVDRPITSEGPGEEVTVSCRCGWKAVFNFETEKVTEIERP